MDALQHARFIVKKYAWEKERLESQLRVCVAEAEDRLEENKSLIKENEELRIEVEKIHSRFDILEL